MLTSFPVWKTYKLLPPAPCQVWVDRSSAGALNEDQGKANSPTPPENIQLSSCYCNRLLLCIGADWWTNIEVLILREARLLPHFFLSAWAGWQYLGSFDRTEFCGPCSSSLNVALVLLCLATLCDWGPLALVKISSPLNFVPQNGSLVTVLLNHLAG